MKKLILLSLAAINLFSACLTSYEKALPMTSYQKVGDKEIPKQIYCPKKEASDPANCVKPSFVSIENGEPYCIYFETELDNSSDFTLALKKQEYLASVYQDSELTIINNKLDLPLEKRNEKVNQELIKARTPSSDANIMQYFPGYFEDNFVKDFKKKISSPLSVTPKFKTTVIKNENLCTKCKSEMQMPSIGINNFLDQIDKEIAQLEDNIKDQASDAVDELSSSIMDLTSDEAIIYYYIMAISYSGAMASCTYKSYVPVSTDVMSASKTAIKATTTTATVKKDNTDSKADQTESVTNENCYFAFEDECLIGNFWSGQEEGVRDKTQSTGEATKETEAQSMPEAIDEIAYDECMKTEPDKIQDKITNFLKNTVNGVEIDLFAVKECNDKHTQKAWKSGLGEQSKDESENQQLLLEKIMNFTVSYVDTQRHAAAGYLDQKEEQLKDFLNGDKKNKNLDKMLLKKLNEVNSARNKSSRLRKELEQELFNKKSYSVAIRNALDLQIKDLEKAYSEYNGMENIIKNIVDSMKEETDLTMEDSDILMDYTTNSLKFYYKSMNKLVSDLGTNPNKKFSKTIGCIEYNEDNECLSVGVRYKLFPGLKNAINDFKNSFFVAKYPVFENKSMEDIQAFISEKILKNGDLSQIDSIEKFKIYLDYLVLETYIRSVHDLQKMELDIGISATNLIGNEVETFINLSKKALILVSN